MKVKNPFDVSLFVNADCNRRMNRGPRQFSDPLPSIDYSSMLRPKPRECWHMTSFTYQNSPYPIRDDIKHEYSAYWKRLAMPGSWWTGAERIAIASEVRNAPQCEFCRRRRSALSPYTLEGDHLNDDALDRVAIDAVHRIVTDQSRITRAYVDDNVVQGLSKDAYVELSGIVVAVFSIDEFHRGLGLELEPLPEPDPGEPSRYRPTQAVEDTGFVPMIPRDGATGSESDLWSQGRTANVIRALSLVPDALRDWRRLASAQYLSLEGMGNLVGQDDRAINRMQMELVAGRVSAINQCFY